MSEFEQNMLPMLILSATASITSSFLRNNETQIDEVPGLIKSVYQSLLAGPGGVSDPAPAAAPAAAPAVDPKKSVFPDYIICLEDGRRLKMLKRHLHSSFGLTPDEYRKKWNLPSNYPMVAPNYAETRSDLAKATGLGLHRSSKPAAVAEKTKPRGRARKMAA